MAGNNKIELRKLKDSFFSDHGDLKEIMKKELETVNKKPPTCLWFLLRAWGGIIFLFYLES